MKLRLSAVRRATGWLMMLAGIGACQEAPTALPYAEAIAYAAGGGGKPGSTTVRVDAVDPAWGNPGQALTVRVLGANFEAGSTVDWQRDGVAGEITTHTTRYISASEIEADISITAEASLDLYDVVVLGKTRSGIGTEKFEVTHDVLSDCGGGHVAYANSWAVLDWGSTLAIRNDAFGPYQHGVDNVGASVAYHDDGCSRGGYVVFRFDNGPRSLVVVFPPESGYGTVNITPSVLYFDGAMSLGSDVNQDGDLTSGYDAHMYEKIPGPYSLEHPALSDDRPGYPINVAEQKFAIPVGLSGCSRLEYDRMRLTRTSGQEGFFKLPGVLINGLEAGRWSPDFTGSWTSESVETTVGGSPGHWARCRYSKGKTVMFGPWLDMPFRVDITEHRD